MKDKAIRVRVKDCNLENCSYFKNIVYPGAMLNVYTESDFGYTDDDRYYFNRKTGRYNTWILKKHVDVIRDIDRGGKLL